MPNSWTYSHNQTIVGPAVKDRGDNSAVTFTLARQANAETFYRIIANSSGNSYYVNAEMDSASDNDDETVINSLVCSDSTMLRLDTLAAGTHTAGMTVDVDSGQSTGISKEQIKVSPASWSRAPRPLPFQRRSERRRTDRRPLRGHSLWGERWEHQR